MQVKSAMNQKCMLTLIILGSIGLLSVYGFIKVNNPMGKITAKPGNGIAVVELFTSEGCSSCPAADEAIERLLKKNTADVYILVYHVDYWNRLGWIDPFSQPAWSERQYQYANALHLNSVYTPQVIINGTKEFVGSDESQLVTSVQNNLANSIPRSFNVKAQRSKNVISIHYEINNPYALLLNFAIVQPETTVAVKRGENAGRTLHHVNIVRLLKTIDAAGDGDVLISIPTELTDIPLQLIAYIQDKKSFRVTGAVKIAL
jgi:hypothetical protein